MLSLKALAAMMGHVGDKYLPDPHAGGVIGQQFNYYQIQHVRKNNQRNKNQKRIRGRK